MQRDVPGYVDKATLPAVVLAYSTRYYEPDSFIHECVVGFLESFLADVFTTASYHHLKSLYARPLLKIEAGPRYFSLTTKVTRLEDHGVPVSRQRKYSSGHLQPLIEVSPAGIPKYEELFFRTLEATFSIYIVAPDHIKQRDNQQVAQSTRGSSFTLHGGNMCTEDMLCNSAMNALDGYMALATQKGLMDNNGQWKVPQALVNISDNPSFSKTVSVNVAPTLVRNNKKKQQQQQQKEKKNR